MFALFINIPSILFAADTLIFAIDIIRHGDRTPLMSLPTVNYQWKEGFGQLTATRYVTGIQSGSSLSKKIH